jgi:triacylglycerol lipase
VIARLERTTVLLLLVVASLWFTTRAWDGQWAAAALGGLLLLNIQPLAMTIEFFVMLPLVNRSDVLPKPSVAQLLCAWWKEARTAHAVFNWQQPFRSRAHADTLAGARQGQRALVLVHGFFCNRGLWNPWMLRLQAEGVPYVALTLEPPFGSIDEYANAIDDAITRAASATGVSPVLVGHSMGGLAIRAWWRAQGPAGDSRVHSAVTIASPHLGTFTARFARAVNAQQMRLGSSWLHALASDEPAQRRARFTCYYSHCDNISMPASTAALPGADNRHLACRSHLALAFAPEVFTEVLRRAKLSSG